MHQRLFLSGEGSLGSVLGVEEVILPGGSREPIKVLSALARTLSHDSSLQHSFLRSTHPGIQGVPWGFHPVKAPSPTPPS